MCLRINSVPVPSRNDKADCVGKVYELIMETGFYVLKGSIDRVHRICCGREDDKQHHRAFQIFLRKNSGILASYHYCPSMERFFEKKILTKSINICATTKC